MSEFLLFSAMIFLPGSSVRMDAFAGLVGLCLFDTALLTMGRSATAIKTLVDRGYDAVEQKGDPKLLPNTV